MPSPLGSGLDDLLIGTEEDEILRGFAGNDTIFGGGGDDTIGGGLGADSLSGGEGRDMVSYAGVPAGVVVQLHYHGWASGGGGFDALWHSPIWPYPMDFEDAHGSAYADTLLGAEGANLLLGAAGDDLIRGLGGQDTLIGGDGADTLTGHLNSSIFTGGAGADLFGIVLPIAAPQALDPIAAATRITDFAADDSLRLALASDEAPPAVYPPGSLVLSWPSLRTTFASHVDGPRGYLPLVWTGAAPTKVPMTGMALPGAELAPYGYITTWLSDPAGGGWLMFDLSGDWLLGPGDSVIRFDAPNPLTIGPADIGGSQPIQAQLGTHVGDLLLGRGLPDAHTIPPLQISADQDNGLDDMLSGGAGDDTLRGGAGADLLMGGDGADWMEGGSGSDTYVVDHRGDRVVELSDVHSYFTFDHVRASIHFTLGARIEWLTLLEEGGAINGNGNASANLITGNAHANRLLGRDGGDTLVGAGGRDSAFGEAGDDFISGNDGDDLLGGGAGGDILAGGADNDVLRGDDGADQLFGDDGNDQMDGGAGGDTLDGGAGNDRLLGGAGNDQLSGGRGTRDTLFGGGGDDTLHGAGEGVVPGDGDRLVGGLGNDRYWIEAPGDVAVERMGEGNDTIMAYLDVETYTLPDAFEGLGIGGSITTAIGNRADNSIVGHYGNERLEGRGGGDTLAGGYGDDTLVGGEGGDLFSFVLWMSGNDIILDFVPGVDRLALEDWRLDDPSVLYALTEDTADGALLSFDPWNPAGGTVLFAGVAKGALLPGDLTLV